MRPRLASLGVFAAAVASQQPTTETPKQVVLRVPFALGERCEVSRGPGQATHADAFNRNAVDFGPLPEGHPIVSASRGTVVWVKEDTSGPTGDYRDNNEVAVAMPNGVDFVVYLHLAKDGAVVEVGDEVLPGDLIGFAGNTGKSEGTHLHLDVRKGHRGGPSIPWCFGGSDIEMDSLAGKTLKSETVSWRALLAPCESFVRLSALATELGDLALVTGMRAELAARADSPAPNRDVEFEAYLREQVERIEASWKDAAARSISLLEQAKDEEERGVLALSAAQCFVGTDAAKAAYTIFEALDPEVRKKSRRVFSLAAKRRAPVQVALNEEWKLALAGFRPPFAASVRKKLEAAYERAARLVSENHANKLRDHLSKLK